MDPYIPAIQKQFKGHKAAVTCMSFHPTKKALATSSEDGSIILWNSGQSMSSLRFVARKLPVTHVHFSPQGDVMAASQGQYVRLWVPHVHGRSVEFKAHLSIVRSVEFSPDATFLVTASDDKTLKTWITAKRKFVSSFTGHTNWVRNAKYSYDGNMLVSCSDDRTIKLWDVRSGRNVHTYEEQRGLAKYVEFHPSGTCIGAAMTHNVIKVYEIRSHKLLQYYKCHTGEVNMIAFHPLGDYMMSASDDRTCKVIDLLEGRPILSIESHQSCVTAIAFAKSGNHFASATLDRQVLLWKSNFDEKVVEEPNRPIKESLGFEHFYNNIQKVSPNPANENSKEDYIRDIYSADDYDEEKSGKGHYSKSVSSTSKYDSRYRSKESISEMESQIECLTIENAELKKRVHELENGMSKMEEIFKAMKGISSQNYLNDAEPNPHMEGGAC